MTCLPFGIACAPKIFASLANWVAQTLRDRGIRVIVYLDDFLLAHQDPRILYQQALETTSILESLGWRINYSKSTLDPQMNLQYLGIVWDPHKNRKYLPIQKSIKLRQKLLHLVQTKKANLKEVQSIVGSVNFASFPVPRGRLNHRALLKLCQMLLRRNPRYRFPITPEALVELQWWITI